MMKVKNWLLVAVRYILLFIIMGIVYGCLSAILDYLYIGKNADFSLKMIFAYSIYFYIAYFFVYIPFTIIIYLLKRYVPVFKNLIPQFLLAILIGCYFGYTYYNDVFSIYIGGSDYLGVGRQIKMIIVFSITGVVYIILNSFFLKKWLLNHSLKK